MVFMRLLKKLIDNNNAQIDYTQSSAGAMLAGALEKLGKNGSRTWPTDSNTATRNTGMQTLCQELESLVQILKQTYRDKSTNPFRGFEVSAGTFAAPEDSTGQGGRGLSQKSEKVPFLFLRVPGRQGYLIEQEGENTLVMYRGRESVPLLWNESTAENARPTVVSRSTTKLLQLEQLEEDLWRITWCDSKKLLPEQLTEAKTSGLPLTFAVGRTLYASQLGEALIAIAVEEMSR